MGYTTSTAYQTADRMIVDVRALSFSIWKRRSMWRWRWYGWLWVCLGPFEIMLHPLRRKGKRGAR